MKGTSNNLTSLNREELIIQHLLDGKTQIQISTIFKEQGIEPNSLSYIEKTIKMLREIHGAKTMFHLGVYVVKLTWTKA